jgi:hypothetical protein
VYLNTGGVSINSIDIGISYPQDLLVFKGYQEDSGVVKLWLNHPEDQSGIIQMKGIIPGGAEGLYDPSKKNLSPLPITRLLFIAKKLGEGTLAIDHSTVLLNNGYGTELSHDKLNTSIKIESKNEISQENTTKANELDDVLPPEQFSISFVKSNFFSKTPSMLIFDANDLDSGIERYEINIDGEWIKVSSPLPMYKSFFSKQVIIRAVDYYGNIRESNIIISGILSTIALVVICIFILIFAYSRFSWYKKKR